MRVRPNGKVAEGHCLAIVGVSQLLAAVAELGCEEARDAVNVPADEGDGVRLLKSLKLQKRMGKDGDVEE
jgi:hypothetical protein